MDLSSHGISNFGVRHLWKIQYDFLLFTGLTLMQIGSFRAKFTFQEGICKDGVSSISHSSAHLLQYTGVLTVQCPHIESGLP